MSLRFREICTHQDKSHSTEGGSSEWLRLERPKRMYAYRATANNPPRWRYMYSFISIFKALSWRHFFVFTVQKSVKVWLVFMTASDISYPSDMSSKPYDMFENCADTWHISEGNALSTLYALKSSLWKISDSSRPYGPRTVWYSS